MLFSLDTQKELSFSFFRPWRQALTTFFDLWCHHCPLPSAVTLPSPLLESVCSVSLLTLCETTVRVYRII